MVEGKQTSLFPQGPVTKVARSDFGATILFKFERPVHHHYQSTRKSNVTGVLEKDESFK